MTFPIRLSLENYKDHENRSHDKDYVWKIFSDSIGSELLIGLIGIFMGAAPIPRGL